MSAVTKQPDLRRERSQQEGMALQVGGLLSVIIPVLALFVNTGSRVPVGVRLMAAGLWGATTLPLALYLRTPLSERRPIPFIQVIGFLYAFYYALGPMFGMGNAHYDADISINPARDLWKPMLFATVGWGILLGGYRCAINFIPAKRLFARSIDPEKFAEKWGGVLVALGIFLQVGGGRSLVPAGLDQLIHVMVRIGWASAAVMVYLIAKKRASQTTTLVGIGGTVILFLLNATSGSVAPAARFSVFIGIAYVLGRGRVPWRFLPVAIVLITLLLTLRGVIIDYRKATWFSGANMSEGDRVVLMAGLLQERMKHEGVGGTIAHGAETAYGRSANLELFADVVRRTPRQVPYWGGQTYLSLVGAFVPRLLWPNKPTKELGQAFGHRYGYLAPSNKSTAFNLPSLVEFYANFGEWGVYIGMFILGAVYAVANQLANRPRQSIVATMFGFVLILPLFNLESDFSLTVGGLFLEGAFLFVVYRVIQAYH